MERGALVRPAAMSIEWLGVAGSVVLSAGRTEDPRSDRDFDFTRGSLGWL
jgi:hypothetical protein